MGRQPRKDEVPSVAGTGTPKLYRLQCHSAHGPCHESTTVPASSGSTKRSPQAIPRRRCQLAPH